MWYLVAWGRVMAASVIGEQGRDTLAVVTASSSVKQANVADKLMEKMLQCNLRAYRACFMAE